VKVLYLHGEMTRREIYERQRAAVKTIPPDRVAPFARNFASGRNLNSHLISHDGQKAIEEEVKCFRPEVLILDPWQSFMQGHDENAFKDVSQATSFLDKLIADYGLCLFLPFHQGKDRSKGVRGHSTIQGWRDTLITLTRKGEESVTVQVWPRWAEPLDPFKLQFRDGTMWPAGPLWTKQTAAIHGFLSSRTSRSAEASEIASGLGINLDAARKAADRAVGEGAIAHERNTARYFIPWDPDGDL
jgi:hypothetical protein